MVSGACSQHFFGQIWGLFKEFGAKRGGRAPPAPPHPLDPRLKEIETQTRSERYCCHESHAVDVMTFILYVDSMLVHRLRFWQI